MSDLHSNNLLDINIDRINVDSDNDDFSLSSPSKCQRLASSLFFEEEFQPNERNVSILNESLEINALRLQRDNILYVPLTGNTEINSYIALDSVYDYYESINNIDYYIINEPLSIKRLQIKNKVSGHNTSDNLPLTHLFKIDGKWYSDYSILMSNNDKLITIWLQYICFNDRFVPDRLRLGSGRSYDSAASVAYYLDPLLLDKVLPAMPKQFQQNRNQKQWLKDTKNQQYTMFSEENNIESIAIDFKNFFETEFAEQPLYTTRV